VAANGNSLHLLEQGDEAGPPVVVLPGITSPATTWQFVAEQLATTSRVFVVDNRGRGLSDAPLDGHDLETYAEDIAGLIVAVGIDRPIVLGHSMGARIAAALAVAHPDIARAWIIVDPPLTGPGRDPYPTPLSDFVDGLALARAGATAEDMRPFFPSWPDRELEIRATWLATCDEHAVRETYARFSSEDFFPLWRRLRGPALFVRGADSLVVTDAGLAEIEAANPAIPTVSIPHAGHMIPWDNLAGFIAVVQEFIAAHAHLPVPHEEHHE
jgi:N-formylmaleamate deformylase